MEIKQTNKKIVDFSTFPRLQNELRKKICPY